MEINLLEKGASSEIVKDGFKLNLHEISEWLKCKNILSENDMLVSYDDVLPWKRAGAETYHTTFKIKSKRQSYQIEEKLINIKAIVAIPPEERLADWAKRKKLLDLNNIPTSNWYWWGDGIIIEDFYPNEYKDFSNFNTLIEIAIKLDNLGFACLNFLTDIRCDIKGNPFYIDFGFDLGEFSYFRKDNCINQLKTKFPNNEQKIIHYLKQRIKK